MGFLSGSVIKKPPANAGDTGSIPGLGRSRAPQDNQDQDPELRESTARAAAAVRSRLAAAGGAPARPGPITAT